MLSENQFRTQIINCIYVGMDANTENSTFRIVQSINDEVIVIPKGKKSKMSITWEMLYKCYKHLFTDAGYSKDVFRRYYPELDRTANCYVNTIGQIFVLSGMAVKTKAGNLSNYNAK